jgi:hypothetical protein
VDGGGEGGSGRGPDGGGGTPGDAGGDGRAPCKSGSALCGGTCIDVATDPNNCGSCGFVCTIAPPSTVECAAGHCIATLATIPGQLGDAFVDSSNVYAFDDISQSAVKVPLIGGASTTMLAGKAKGRLVAIDYASFYWFGTDSQIWFAALDGTADPRPLSTKVSTPVGMSVDESGLYFGSGSELVMVDLRGGDPMSLATPGPGADIGGLTSDATSFYFTDSSGNVSSVGRAGGTPKKLAFNQTEASEIAVSATDVYWKAGDQSTGQTALWSVPITGGEWTRLKTFATHIRIDGTSLYGQADPTGLVKIPLGGGATILLSASRTAVPGAFDATSVYWSENTSTGVSKLMKLWPK